MHQLVATRQLLIQDARKLSLDTLQVVPLQQFRKGRKIYPTMLPDCKKNITKQLVRGSENRVIIETLLCSSTSCCVHL